MYHLNFRRKVNLHQLDRATKAQNLIFRKCHCEELIVQRGQHSVPHYFFSFDYITELGHLRTLPFIALSPASITELRGFK